MSYFSAKHIRRPSGEFDDFHNRFDLLADDFLFATENERLNTASSGYIDNGRSLAAGSQLFAISNPVATSGSTIEHSAKIGIGTWDVDGSGTALNDLGKFDFGWYYNWQARPLWTPDLNPASDKGFVPMIWGKNDVTSANLQAAESSSSSFVLGFNEPDNSSQANMTVAQALKLWPKLMSTDKLLGSPATMTSGTLGDDSWLGNFMSRAEAKGYDVDFVAVHYYSDDPSIGAFKDFLQEVKHEYGKPVWVTEWALVDWNDPDRFSPTQLANFAEEATQMMDDLRFVKRHAWFGAYAGGWDTNTELLDDNSHLTKVGDTFSDLTL